MESSQYGIFSIRFWTNEQGEKIFNPFLFCLNLLESESSSCDPVEVTYKIAIYNRALDKYDESIEGVTALVLDRSDQIRSVGVENVTLKDENYNEDGDILLRVVYHSTRRLESTKLVPKFQVILKARQRSQTWWLYQEADCSPCTSRCWQLPLLCSPVLYRG
eukprot:TRINITY_DN36002_c0_g1_i1.p1 TRINITY_DN36002_c0_g1~~TRINITY_DN36002_c0_g1_i1.p1  ORF type:complete len:162 (+),score=29.12 TRINITY_DN36002_c0_g1_i1:300-785(+)